MLSKTIALLVSVVFLGISLTADATAPSSLISTHQYPLLIGVWKAHTTVMNAQGQFNDLDWQLTFKNQANNYLSGTSSWAIGSNFKTSDNQPLSYHGSEPFIGLFSLQPRHFFMAQTQEHSIMQGQIVDKDHIKVVYIEAGSNAAVTEAEFSRQKKPATLITSSKNPS